MKAWHYILIIGVLLTGGFLWYRMKPTTSTTAAPVGYVDSFGLGLTQAEEAELKGWRDHIMNSVKNSFNGWSEANIQKGADENNVTYDDQITISALYQMYATKHVISQKRYSELFSLIKSR